jgi:hypothetical protein
VPASRRTCPDLVPIEAVLVSSPSPHGGCWYANDRRVWTALAIAWPTKFPIHVSTWPYSVSKHEDLTSQMGSCSRVCGKMLARQARLERT